MTNLELFRVYLAAGQDGYPPEWFRLPEHLRLPGQGEIGIKDIVRQQAGNRCVRCKHPYVKGAAPIERTVVDGEEVRTSWSSCDEQCEHGAPMRIMSTEGWIPFDPTPEACGPAVYAVGAGNVQAAWRILTTHHLNGVKLDCRWFNLVPLCQRDHLTIQGKVKLDREFVREHSPWFKPYAAGWYAWKYEGVYITREEAEERMDELLAYELHQKALW